MPSKLNITETWPEQHFNMCGWTLLRRWSTLISDEEWQIPVDLSQITPTKLQSLQLAIEASQEDWRAVGIDHTFLRFATQLRPGSPRSHHHEPLVSSSTAAVDKCAFACSQSRDKGNNHDCLLRGDSPLPV